jgi:hypothetical protein
LPDRSLLAADRATASIVAPLVELPRRKEKTPPSRKKRADDMHLDTCRAFYVSGGDHPVHGRLRSATLSDEVAGSYWNRFLLFVRFVDDNADRSPAHGTVREYLQIKHLEAYFKHLAATPIKTKSRETPVSTGWLDAVKRALNSLADVFVRPDCTPHEWAAYTLRSQTAKSKAVKDTQAAPKPRRADDQFEPDPSRPDGGVWIRMPPATLSDILTRLHLYETQVGRLEYKVSRAVAQQSPKYQRLELELAEGKQGLLASKLLLWVGCRTSDVRCLVVNWDITTVRGPSGDEGVFVCPAQDKVHWRHSTASQVADAGKRLHPKLQALYEQYLAKHRPVLMKSLGHRAKWDRVFTDDKDGPGASRCFTLFPGYWDKHQTTTFTARFFMKVLGHRERAVRKVLSGTYNTHIHDWNLEKTAISQNLSHSGFPYTDCRLSESVRQ